MIEEDASDYEIILSIFQNRCTDLRRFTLHLDELTLRSYTLFTHLGSLAIVESLRSCAVCFKGFAHQNEITIETYSFPAINDIRQIVADCGWSLKVSDRPTAQTSWLPRFCTTNNINLGSLWRFDSSDDNNEDDYVGSDNDDW
jgi:hypothetical protein